VGEAVIAQVEEHKQGCPVCKRKRRGNWKKCKRSAVFADRPWKYKVPVTQKDLDYYKVNVTIKLREPVSPSASQMITWIAVRNANRA